MEKLKEMIPDDVNVKLADAVTDDFMTLSWNLNARDP